MCEQRHFKGTSGAVGEEYSLEWKIENFLVIKSSTDLMQQKFPFETGATHGNGTTMKWECFLHKRAESRNIGVFLKLISAPPKFKTCVVSYNCKTIKPNGAVFAFGKGELRQFTSESAGCGFHDFILTDEEELKKLLWEDGSIVIQLKIKLFLCTLVAVVQTDKVDFEEELNNFEKQELQKLSNMMTRIIGVAIYPETGKIIKVVSKDNEEFYANTAILSTRSPVFQAMFASENWKEGQSQGPSGDARLVLEDLSGKTVKVLLHYLMGGVLLKDDWKAEDVLLELTWAVGKYQLEGLTEFLDKVLPALDYNGTEVLAKLALLARRLGMKNAEEKLLLKLKETATTIDELILDKASFLQKD